MKSLGDSDQCPRLVTFDLFNTILCDADAAVGHQRRKDYLRRILLQENLGNYKSSQIDTAYRDAEHKASLHSRQVGRQPSLEIFVSNFAKRLGAGISQELCQRTAQELQSQSSIDSVDVSENIVEIIRRISARRVQLGIVSNNFFHSPETILTVLRQQKVLRYFDPDSIVFSSAVGICKPNPEIFLRLCQKLHIPPTETVHVGDSEETDYVGSAAAGISCILVDPWGVEANRLLEDAFAWID